MIRRWLEKKSDAALEKISKRTDRSVSVCFFAALAIAACTILWLGGGALTLFGVTKLAVSAGAYFLGLGGIVAGGGTLFGIMKVIDKLDDKIRSIQQQRQKIPVLQKQTEPEKVTPPPEPVKPDFDSKAAARTKENVEGLNQIKADKRRPPQQKKD